MKLKKIAALLAVAGMSVPAFATNGLNMEGYGPIATGMGGASMAYDNGTAGLINNPATLGLMKSGTARLDLALGALNPEVSVHAMGFSAESAGKTYLMPAAGYVRKDGNITWGIGMMSQGGMGTEFSGNNFLTMGQANALAGKAPFGPTGLGQRSELGIGRVMLPLVFDVSPTFRIGGTLDYLWGGMDMNMQADGNTLDAMAANFGNANKRAVGFIGTKTNAAMLTMLGTMPFNYGYFNFSEGTDKFKQQLTTSGWAGNIGFTWQATPALSVGAVYHAKTSLSDMSGTGNMIIGNPGGAGAAVQMRVPGTLKIVNFQWPETYGIGLSYQATDKWQFALDYKNIPWSSTFQNMTMIFTAPSMGAVGEFGFNLNWKDQNVFQLGAAYKWDDKLTLRFGANLSDQMVTPANLIPIFPAVTTSHFTLGAGYMFDKAMSVDFSLSHAPRDSVTNPGLPASAAIPPFVPPVAAGPAVSAGMSQTNWQLMFSNRF